MVRGGNHAPPGRNEKPGQKAVARDSAMGRGLSPGYRLPAAAMTPAHAGPGGWRYATSTTASAISRSRRYADAHQPARHLRLDQEPRRAHEVRRGRRGAHAPERDMPAGQSGSTPQRLPRQFGKGTPQGLADFTGAIRHHAGPSGRFTTRARGCRHQGTGPRTDSARPRGSRGPPSGRSHDGREKGTRGRRRGHYRRRARKRPKAPSAPCRRVRDGGSDGAPKRPCGQSRQGFCQEDCWCPHDDAVRDAPAGNAAGAGRNRALPATRTTPHRPRRCSAPAANRVLE